MFDMNDLFLRYQLDRRHFQELTQFTTQRVDELLDGESPSLAELREIAAVLKVPVWRLVPKKDRANETKILFRQSLSSDESVSAPLIEDLSRRVSNSIELVGTREGFAWADAFRPELRNFRSAESMARQFRSMFYGKDMVSPILTLPHIVVKDMNVLLFVLRLQEIEGASAFIGGQPFIFLAERFAPRMLFTLAHEVGHLLVDREHQPDFAHLDVEGVSEGRRRLTLVEEFANAFAAAVLLPSEGIGRSLQTIRKLTKVSRKAPIGDLDIIFLSRVYGTSFSVAAKRCEDLELLPKGSGQLIYEEVCKRHNSPEKRGDGAGLPRRQNIDFPGFPLHLLDCAVGKVWAGEESIGKMAAMLGMTIPDLMDANALLSH